MNTFWYSLIQKNKTEHSSELVRCFRQKFAHNQTSVWRSQSERRERARRSASVMTLVVAGVTIVVRVGSRGGGARPELATVPGATLLALPIPVSIELGVVVDAVAMGLPEPVQSRTPAFLPVFEVADPAPDEAVAGAEGLDVAGDGDEVPIDGSRGGVEGVEGDGCLLELAGEIVVILGECGVLLLQRVVLVAERLKLACQVLDPGVEGHEHAVVVGEVVGGGLEELR